MANNSKKGEKSGKKRKDARYDDVFEGLSGDSIPDLERYRDGGRGRGRGEFFTGEYEIESHQDVNDY